MASSNPPVRGEDFVISIGLEDYNVQGRLKASPTIASGDFKISKDGGALANLNTLPTNDPAGSKFVTITLSSTEMDADRVSVICSDQTDPPEWCDLAFSIPTTAA